MPRPTNSIDILTKYVKGIDRYDNTLGFYDVIFRHYRTGKVEYVRKVMYDFLLKTITEYLDTRHKSCVGVFQNTLYKEMIMVVITG